MHPFLKAVPLYRVVRTVYVRALQHRVHFARRRYERIVAEEYERAIDLAVRYLKGGMVEGDIAEFGCLGESAAVECRQLAAFGLRRALHLFDSFKGSAPFTDEDRAAPEIIAGDWRDIGEPSRVSPADLRCRLSALYDPGLIHIYEGFFSDTLTSIPPQTRFGMVVLDCVIYSATDQVLDYLFANGLVSEGAVLLISSWNVSRGSPEQSTRKAWNKAVLKYRVQYSDEGRYNWGGARFIVHGYSTIPA